MGESGRSGAGGPGTLGCETPAVYRSIDPQNLIQPVNDVVSQGIFSGSQWTEQVPGAGSPIFYARVTADPFMTGINRKWLVTAGAAPPTELASSGMAVYFGNTSDGTIVGTKAASGLPLGETSVGAASATPVVARLSDNNSYVFVTTGDAHLYKINADTMALSGSRNLRRGICAADTISAAPVVQTVSQSNQDFQTAVGEDLVYVATHHGCGDSTGNQVIALRASDPNSAPVWIVNVGEYEMDFVSGCTLDVASNRLYCGSNLPINTFQFTVWAINTLDGSLLWAGSLGSVHTPPMFNTSSYNHVYTLDTDGMLRALNADSGFQHWALDLIPAIPNPPVESGIALGTDLYNSVLFVTAGGQVHAVFDGGPEAFAGSELYSTSFSKPVIGTPAVASHYGLMYVPVKDGFLHQLDLSTGFDQAFRAITLGPDPFVSAATFGNPGFDPGWLVASSYADSSGSQVKRFCIPWAPGSSGI